jgi:3-methyladenine DNA glycosylase/8-oxoguanine DNA glycosylase
MSKNIIFKTKKSFFIKPASPYNFNSSIFKPSHYPDPLKIYEPNKYWFVLNLGKNFYGIKFENQGTIKRPKIKITIFSRKKLLKYEFGRIIDELSYRFEFQRDISSFLKKFQKDSVLGKFIKKWYGMHGTCTQDLYGLLMIGIFLQNTIIKRTVQMTETMLKKYGNKVRFDKKIVYSFWSPEKMSNIAEEELRKLKVGYRAKLFIKLSASFVKEKVSEKKIRELSHEDKKKVLLKLYGVGPETARILLTEAFHYYDIFDHVAPWQQKIYSRLLFNKKMVPTSKIIKYVKNKWGNWANLAASYIWEDIFWQKKKGKKIEWLEKEIRL